MMQNASSTEEKARGARILFKLSTTLAVHNMTFIKGMYVIAGVLSWFGYMNIVHYPPKCLLSLLYIVVILLYFFV